MRGTRSGLLTVVQHPCWRVAGHPALGGDRYYSSRDWPDGSCCRAPHTPLSSALPRGTGERSLIWLGAARAAV